MSAIQQALLGEAVAGGAGATDPFFSSVVLLCHFEGTNGQTTATDSSTSPHTLTLNGALSSARSKFGATSMDTSAGPAYVTTPNSAHWNFGAGQFTIEGWVNFATAPTGVELEILAGVWASSSDLGFEFGYTSGNIAFWYSTTGSDFPVIQTAWSPSANVWYHIAVDRDASNVLRIYVDGVVKTSTTLASTLFNSTRALYVCNDGNGIRPIKGYTDEVRITKGVARYGGAFTAPTAAFPDS